MKKIQIAILCALISFAAVKASAQTVDEIIDKYTDALGGKAKLGTLKTVRMDGNMNIQGTDVAIVNTRLNMVGSRTDISVMGTENYQLVTATKGWVYMPIQGQTAPEEMPDDQFKNSYNLLDVQGILFNYKDKGVLVELAGKESSDGAENYKLKVTNKLGFISNYFIDTKTYRVNKVSAKISVNGEEMDVTTSFSNYKQNADGFWFAYTSSSTRGEINYDKIETNIAVDEKIFKVN